MINQQVSQILDQKFPGSVIIPEEAHNDYIQLNTENWEEIAKFLKSDAKLYFDSCQCIEIRIATDRKRPSVPSVEQIWRVADWFEREVYDMYGIRFKGHRDLRRMLLPDDWKGWPLRKDYKTPQTYNGMRVPKVRKGWD